MESRLDTCALCPSLWAPVPLQEVRRTLTYFRKQLHLPKESGRRRGAKNLPGAKSKQTSLLDQRFSNSDFPRARDKPKNLFTVLTLSRTRKRKIGKCGRSFRPCSRVYLSLPPERSTREKDSRNSTPNAPFIEQAGTPGESANAVPHYHKLCSRVSHIWGNRRGQHIRSAMDKPRPGKTTFVIMVSPLPGKYELLTPPTPTPSRSPGSAPTVTSLPPPPRSRPLHAPHPSFVHPENNLGSLRVIHTQDVEAQAERAQQPLRACSSTYATPPSGCPRVLFFPVLVAGSYLFPQETLGVVSGGRGRAETAPDLERTSEDGSSMGKAPGS
ncbi:uncharacterized protein LOC141578032 [Camelus bactrianus]|uniref:Uncharacterized protein LOC141578032 n=1 Tax=Camelus bactrianus TaxID=9837 RepID=A0AC58QK83_CAMBA